MSESWYVYMLECSDGSIYTGVTKDMDRRLHEHNHTSRGAKYTHSRRPVCLVWSKMVSSRSEAQQEEYRIKNLKRSEKLSMING
jgi:putative endonuclease